MNKKTHFDSPFSLSRWLSIGAMLALFPVTQIRLCGANAAEFIQGLIQTNYRIEITLTSMNVNGAVGYAHFRLVGKSDGHFTPNMPVPHLNGVTRELFNDRHVGSNSNPNTQPFDLAQYDLLEIDISTTEVLLTLQSWGNAKIHFAPSLVDNLLYGWAPDGKTYFIIYFKTIRPGSS